MTYIKHRANDLSLKYEGPIEVDLWGFNGKLSIGHDEEGTNALSENYEFDKTVWVHCKNIEAYKRALRFDYPVKAFMHDKEPIAFVQGGYFWTTIPDNVCGLTVFMDVPGTKYTIEEIAMIRRGHGVCSDYPEKWEELFK